jgi:hypothetical protein
LADKHTEIWQHFHRYARWFDTRKSHHQEEFPMFDDCEHIAKEKAKKFPHLWWIYFDLAVTFYPDTESGIKPYATAQPGSVKVSLMCGSLESLFLAASAVASAAVQRHSPGIQASLQPVEYLEWNSATLPETLKSTGDVVMESQQVELPCTKCGRTVAGTAQTLFLGFGEAPLDALGCFVGFRKGCACGGEDLVCLECGAWSECRNTASLVSALEHHLAPGGEHRPIPKSSERRQYVKLRLFA